MTAQITYKGHQFDYTAAVNLMDAETREALAGEVSFDRFDTEQSFFDAYVIAHAKRFGEEFVIN